MNIEKEIIEFAKAVGADLYKLEIPFPNDLDIDKKREEKIEKDKKEKLINLVNTIKETAEHFKSIEISEFTNNDIDDLFDCCKFSIFNISILNKEDLSLLNKEQRNVLYKSFIDLNNTRKEVYNHCSIKFHNLVKEIDDNESGKDTASDFQNMSKEELIKYIVDHQ